MARDEKRTTRPFTGRLDTRSLETLQRMADADERSLTYMIQQAVDAYIKARPTRAPRKATPAPTPDAGESQAATPSSEQ